MKNEERDEMDQPEDDGMGLVVPFIVCQSKGGPYEDEAFVAGFSAGMIDRALQVAVQTGATEVVATVRADLVKQLELISMHRGFPVMEAVETEVDGWSFVKFRTYREEQHW